MSYRDMNMIAEAENAYDGHGGMAHENGNITNMGQDQEDAFADAVEFNTFGWLSLWFGMTIFLILIPICCDSNLRAKLCTCLFRSCGVVELSPQNHNGISVTFSAGTIRSRRQVQASDALEIEKEAARAAEARRLIDELLEGHTMVLDEKREKALKTFHNVDLDPADKEDDLENPPDANATEVPAKKIQRRLTSSPCIYIPVPGKSVKDEDMKKYLDGISEPKEEGDAEAMQLEEGVLSSALGLEDSSALRPAPVTCAVCLDTYDVGDSICWSANGRCCHVFHRECITDWLMQKPKKSRRAASEEEEDTDVPEPLVGLPMTCPCCREKFVRRADDESD